MSSLGNNDNGKYSQNSNPNFNPSSGPSDTFVQNMDNSKKKNKKKNTVTQFKKNKLNEEQASFSEMELELNKMRKACDKLSSVGSNHDANNFNTVTMENFTNKYLKWLPDTAKKELDLHRKASIEKESNIYWAKISNVQMY